RIIRRTRPDPWFLSGFMETWISIGGMTARLFLRLRLFVIRLFVHAAFEIANAFAHAFHQRGQAAAAEEDEDDHQEDDHFSRSEVDKEWDKVVHKNLLRVVCRHAPGIRLIAPLHSSRAFAGVSIHVILMSQGFDAIVAPVKQQHQSQILIGIFDASL
ncbi:MAG: hypothetical protein ACREEM_51160, partial [Blastocatellia bacterium]